MKPACTNLPGGARKLEYSEYSGFFQAVICVCSTGFCSCWFWV